MRALILHALAHVPLGRPMSQHMASSEAFVGAGIKASVELIPAGWRQRWILSAGGGINAGSTSYTIVRKTLT